MKTAAMGFAAVMTQLKAWGSESYRKIYAKQGAGANQFGVSMGNLRGLAKKLKTDHALGQMLWATGNFDAMTLATMIMDPERLSSKEIERMVKSLTSWKLIDEVTFKAVARSPSAEELRLRWMDSPKEMIGRAGWNLLVARLCRGEFDGLDLNGLLQRIEAEILKAPYHKQESMNRTLVEIGCRAPAYTKKCIALGERLGRFDPRPVPKGCTAPYAPEWIAAVLKKKK